MEKIFANNFARNYEKNNTWNIRPLVTETLVPSTQRPSNQAYYINDCWIHKIIKIGKFNRVASTNLSWLEAYFRCTDWIVTCVNVRDFTISIFGAFEETVDTWRCFCFACLPKLTYIAVQCKPHPCNPNRYSLCQHSHKKIMLLSQGNPKENK